MRKNDLKLIAFLILVIVLSSFWIQFHSASGGRVQVQINGTVTAEYPLREERTISLSGYQGGSNTLTIAKGEAFISFADCRDHLCVKQGAISKTGESIICLPHRIVITILDSAGNAEEAGDREPRPDSFAN